MRYLFLFIFLFTAIVLPAQEDDFDSWVELNIKRKIVKKVRAELELQYRGKDDLTSRPRYFFSPKINVNLPGPFDVKGLYRHTYKTDDQFVTNRLGLYLYYKNKSIKRTEIVNRLGYQYEFDHLGEVETTIRNKVVITRNFKDWKYDPIIGCEGFYDVHYTGNTFSRVRLSIGFERRVGKKKQKEREKSGEPLPKIRVKKTRVNFAVKREWNLSPKNNHGYIVNLGCSLSL